MLKHSPIWIVLLMLLGVAGAVQAQAKQIAQDIPKEAIGWVEGVAYAVAVWDNYAYVEFGINFTTLLTANFYLIGEIGLHRLGQHGWVKIRRA